MLAFPDIFAKGALIQKVKKSLINSQLYLRYEWSELDPKEVENIGKSKVFILPCFYSLVVLVKSFATKNRIFQLFRGS